jgi:tetratricopeptide (TPR) repeat protein
MKKQFVIGIVGIAIMIASLISHHGDAFAQEGKMITGDTYARTISFGSALSKQNAAPPLATEELLKGDMLSAMEHNERGIRYSEKGQYDLALAEFNKALEIYPLSVEIYNNRGITYSIRGDYDRAIADFTKAVKLNPNAAKTYYNRGITYAAKGQVNNALLDIEKCLELDPANAAVHEARGIVLAALACSDWRNACQFGNCDYIRKAVEIGLCAPEGGANE